VKQKITAARTVSERDDDLQRLAVLWQRRSGVSGDADYRVGPGDVLEIGVAGMEELRNISARVSNEGNISLSFVGAIRVAGLTEAEIKRNLAERLEKDFMHDPQVAVQVREYRARQIAITGAVAKPGLYPLTTGAETLQDAISMAGGFTKEAAPRVLFTAGAFDEFGPKQIVLEAQAGRKEPAGGVQRQDPIIIDFNRPAQENSQRYLMLPVRAGDFIVVPSGGEVLVEGWVEKPGSYKITPGLTLTGALAAAGGSAFAADTSAVKLMRAGKAGEKVLFAADVTKIKSGEAPDIAVQEGDIIEVPSSTPRAFAYGIYSFFSTMVRVGASVPVR
jgi:polysaccharide export outer membrane protein